MKTVFNDRNDWKVLGLLTGVVTFVLFFISPDSYLNDLHTRTDSAWFYMCGKAWMNGLVPYVDFSDSKGPLLWLIYGAGYLLNRTSYVGVYWISCLWYGITCFYSYKTARLFLHDTRRAVVCSLLMLPAFFNPWFHNEIRAEDFCLLFMTVSLYEVSRLMYGHKRDGKEILRCGAVLGACFGALFLIKFNIAAMQAVFLLCFLYYLLHERINCWKPCLAGLGGFAAVTLPFLICFLLSGNLTAFLQEYILNTLKTVEAAAPNDTNILLSQLSATHPLVTYLLEWGDILYCPEIGALFLLLILGSILFLRSGRRYRWMPLFVSTAIFSIAVRHHFLYYFNICAFMLLFLAVGIVAIFGKPFRKWTVPAVAVLSAGILIPCHILTFNFKTLVFNDNINQRDYYRVACIMSQVEHPTLVNAYAHEYGFGVPAGALPAGKYWSKQNGITDRMLDEHKELILSGKADFIILHQDTFSHAECVSEAQLTQAGYHELCRIGEGEDFILLSNRENLYVPEYATPPVRDLLLKKNIQLISTHAI